MKQFAKLGVLFGALFLSTWSFANQPELNVFTPGDLIRSSDVNENFTTLLDLLLGKQTRIAGTCDTGSAIRGINDDGSVLCVSITGASSGISEVSVTTLPAGSEATATLEEISGSDNFRLVLGIPMGEKGPTGPEGPRGEPGNANVAVYSFSVLTTDWDNGLDYGDYNVYRSYTIPPGKVGGTDLRSFFNNGGTVLLYARRNQIGYSEWKLLPYLYSQTKSTGGYMGIRIEYLAPETRL